MITKVVNKKHNVPYDVYIGRGNGSIWGNPFSHLPNTLAQFKVNSREEAIQKHADWILTQPELLRKLQLLWGKTLCCFCDPLPCHGHTLAKVVDNRPIFHVHLTGNTPQWLDYLLSERRLAYNITMSGSVNESYCKQNNIPITNDPTKIDCWLHFGNTPTEKPIDFNGIFRIIK